MHRRRYLRLRTCVVGLLLGMLASPAASALPQHSPISPGLRQARPCWEVEGVPPVHPDFDDDCGGEVAVGAPSWNAPGAVDAGAIAVTRDLGPGTVPILMTTATVGYPQQAGARFGSSLLVTDVDGEPPDDLVVGAPGTTVDGVKGAGAVYIIYGSPSGLGGGKPTLRLTEASLGVGRQA